MLVHLSTYEIVDTAKHVQNSHGLMTIGSMLRFAVVVARLECFQISSLDSLTEAHSSKKSRITVLSLRDRAGLYRLNLRAGTSPFGETSSNSFGFL